MLPSDSPQPSLRCLAIEHFAGSVMTCNSKNECMRWPVDPREPTLDELCMKTLGDFYMCSSGATKPCVFNVPSMNIYEDVHHSIASNFSIATTDKAIEEQACPLAKKNRLPRRGMLTTFDAFIPRKSRAGPNPRKSLRALFYKDCYILRDQTHMFASKLLNFGKKAPLLFINYFAPKGNSGDS